MEKLLSNFSVTIWYIGNIKAWYLYLYWANRFFFCIISCNYASLCWICSFEDHRWDLFSIFHALFLIMHVFTSLHALFPLKDYFFCPCVVFFCPSDWRMAVSMCLQRPAGSSSWSGWRCCRTAPNLPAATLTTPGERWLMVIYFNAVERTFLDTLCFISRCACESYPGWFQPWFTLVSAWAQKDSFSCLRADLSLSLKIIVFYLLSVIHFL